MFLTNKYSLWYFAIIDNAKNQPRKKCDGKYYESHHIIPKSLGGHNRKDNRILLTAKEHYIAHLLLYHMTVGKSKATMWFAFIRMNKYSTKPHRYNSRLFGFFRERYAKAIIGDNNPNFGNRWSEEKKREWSDKCKDGRNKRERNPNFGNNAPHLSKKNKIPKWWINNGTQQKQLPIIDAKNLIASGWLRGRLPMTDEQKVKISVSRKQLFEDGALQGRYYPRKGASQWQIPSVKN